MIIDESDGELDSYRRALELGYRGVSSKNCKGPIKSLLNAGLTWVRNQQASDANYYYLMTGEDLCSVGVVPVQSDLCLAATLGLDHVERNGHHYHPGLSYLPEGAAAAGSGGPSRLLWQDRLDHRPSSSRGSLKSVLSSVMVLGLTRCRTGTTGRPLASGRSTRWG